MGKHANSTDSQILKRIQHRRSVHVFTGTLFDLPNTGPGLTSKCGISFAMRAAL
jgi:hypothetical protein